MNPKLEETIYADFVTSSPTTGAAVDADTTPTCEVFEDNTDVATLAPTVVKRASKTGNYRIPIACTAANGFEASKSYNVVVAAAVGGVAAKAVIQTFQMRTRSEDDLMLAGPVTVGVNSDKTGYSLTSAYDAAKTAAQPGAAMTLTPAYDAAKTASTQASVDQVYAAIDTEVAAIKAKTDQLSFTGGKVDANATLALVAADLTAIADAILKRDWTAVSGEAAYSLLNAARFLRNAWNTPSGVLHVKKEDGVTDAWTRTVAVDPTAVPIVGQS